MESEMLIYQWIGRLSDALGCSRDDAAMMVGVIKIGLLVGLFFLAPRMFGWVWRCAKWTVCAPFRFLRGFWRMTDEYGRMHEVKKPVDRKYALKPKGGTGDSLTMTVAIAKDQTFMAGDPIFMTPDGIRTTQPNDPPLENIKKEEAFLAEVASKKRAHPGHRPGEEKLVKPKDVDRCGDAMKRPHIFILPIGDAGKHPTCTATISVDGMAGVTTITFREAGTGNVLYEFTCKEWCLEDKRVA